MPLNVQMAAEQPNQPRITVIGVGGAGGNAVRNMMEAGLQGVNFIAANTDQQSLDMSPADVKLRLGQQITEGLGAGANPHVGQEAAEESYTDIAESVRGSHMVFITAGMGGGTGTGAAPVVARAAREQGILTVAVVSKPFSFEGSKRMHSAEDGIEELQQYVDTVIVIPNQNLFRIATERTTLQDAFKMADEVLYKGVRGVTDLMMVPGFINLDFNDIRTVMSEMGQAMMGTGQAEGDRRAIMAAEMAISSPLLDGISMAGARGVLINITGGDDMTLYEVDEAANRIKEEVDPDANIIFGTAFDPTVQGFIRVSVVATGLGQHQTSQRRTTFEGHGYGAPQARAGRPQQGAAQQPAQQAEAAKPAASPAADFSLTTPEAALPQSQPQTEVAVSPSAPAPAAPQPQGAASPAAGGSGFSFAPTNVSDFSKKQEEAAKEKDEWDDMERIPAFLRRQAN